MNKIFAGILLSSVAFLSVESASAQSAPEVIRLCTGEDGLPYSMAGKTLAKYLDNNRYKIEVVVNTGGSWGNVQKMIAGECNAMIAQPDALVELKRKNPSEANSFTPIGQLHREYVHVLCSKESGVTDLSDLDNNTDKNKYSVVLGKAGSGAWLVWQNFIAEDQDYAKVAIAPPTSLSVSLTQISQNNITCGLFTAALGNASVRFADENVDGLNLVPLNDKDFNDAVDHRGRPLYVWDKIPSQTYNKRLQTGWLSGVDTISWYATVYIKQGKLSDGAVEAFTQAYLKSKQNIIKEIGELK